MMWPVGWEALEQWGDEVARIAPLAGGVANDVWSVRVDGQLAVGRLLRGGRATRDGGRLAARGGHAPHAAPVDAGLAAAAGLAIVDRPPPRRDRDEDRPRRH